MSMNPEADAVVAAYMDAFVKKVLRHTAEAFGIDYATLSADHGFATGGVVRSNPIRTGEIPAILSRGYDIPASRFWPLRRVFHLGYNPQLLLEDQRDRHP